MVRCRECSEQIDTEPPAAESLDDLLSLAETVTDDPEPVDVVAHDSEPAIEPSAESVPETTAPEPHPNRLPHIKLSRRTTVAVLLAALLGLILWRINPDRSGKAADIELEVPGVRFTQVLYSRDGQLIAGTTSGQVFVWDTPNDEPRELFRLTDQPILAMGLSPDGFLMVSDSDQELSGWQLDDDEIRVGFQMDAHVTCLAIRSPQPGQFEIAIGMTDGSLGVRGPKSERLESGHKGAVRDLLFTRDQKYLITSGADGTIIWRRADSKTVIGRTAAHETDIGALAVADDGRTLASGDWNGNIHLWNVRGRKPQGALVQPDAISGIAFRNEELISASWDGILRFWDLEQESLTREIITGRPTIAMSLHPDKRHVATVSADDRVRIWNVD